MLLHRPAIGRDPELMERLQSIDDKGVEFLRELLGYINEHPNSTCAGILEHWRDTRYEKRLRELSALESPLLSDEISLEESHIKNEFMDYISKIESDYRKRQRESRLKDLKHPDDLRKIRDT